jgi:hypothetical protein
MITETKRRLVEARHAGADRIYGWPLPASLTPRPPLYALQAVDARGRVHFQREFQWPSYIEAVQYWQQLGTPNQTMLPAEEVA